LRLARSLRGYLGHGPLPAKAMELLPWRRSSAALCRSHDPADDLVSAAGALLLGNSLTQQTILRTTLPFARPSLYDGRAGILASGRTGKCSRDSGTFILRGNVVDLAVAVIIGAAFGAITASVTADVITPVISALVGAPDFSTLVIMFQCCTAFHRHPVRYRPITLLQAISTSAKLLNALINFLLVASAIYFAIVMPMQYMLKKFATPAAPPVLPTTKACPECLSEIPLAAKRCAHCAQLVS
jgi:large conductance mechanosensitive channel